MQQIQTLRTYHFTLTSNCGVDSPGKAEEWRRSRLRINVGCNHGDERCKYDSMWPSSYAEAYVKLQFLLYSCMDRIYSHSVCTFIIMQTLIKCQIYLGV